MDGVGQPLTTVRAFPLLPLYHQRSKVTGLSALTAINAPTNAAVVSTRAASSNAPLWVGSRLGKAALVEDLHQQSKVTGLFALTATSAPTNAAVASTRAASSSAPLWVGSRQVKAA